MTAARKKKKGASEEPAYIVPALERGLRMLQAFSKDKPVQSLGLLAKELDLPRATVFRLANTLEHLGYLMRDEDTGEYRIGVSALQLGWNYLSALELPELAYPFLTRLRYWTKASAHLAVRDGRYIVYVCRAPVNAALTSNIRVGSRLPAHATSMGRSLLSDLEDEDFYRVYSGIRELAPFSDETPRTVIQLRNLLAKDAHNDGVVISRAYYEKGVVSVAAPVRDGTDRAVAAINITAPAEQFTDEELRGTVLKEVLNAARDISLALGHDPDSHKARLHHEVAVPSALADPRWSFDDPTEGHPDYVGQEGAERAEREYQQDVRRLEKAHKEHIAELARRYADEDEEFERNRNRDNR